MTIRVRKALAVAAAIAAVLGAIAAIAQLLDYLADGKANLVLGGSVVAIIGACVIVVLAVTFQNPLPLSSWSWLHYLVVSSLALVVASGGLLVVLATLPAPADSPPPPPPPTPTVPPTTVPPTTTPPAGPPGQVEWTRPVASTPPIDPNSDVVLEGTVSDVPDDHAVWIVSKPFDADTDYFVVEGQSLSTGSGGFIGVDEEVGDVDDSGKGFTYTVIDADEECARQLTAASATTDRRFVGGPSGTCHPLGPTARIRIR